MTYIRRNGLIAALAVTALALTACGSDDDTATTTTSSSAPADTGTTTAAAPTGAPIKILQTSPDNNTTLSIPTIHQAADAAVQSINAAGGVAGRPLKIEWCNNRNDPNQAVSCARKAVQSGAIATVGDFVTADSGYMDVLQKAGLPAVGNWPLTPPDYKNPASFPLHGGTTGINWALPTYLKTLGSVKSMAILSYPIASSREAATASKEAAEANGITVPHAEELAYGGPDPSAAVAKAMGGSPDSLSATLSAGDFAKVLQALNVAGESPKVMAATVSLPADTLKSVGPLAEGVYLDSLFPSDPDAPELAEFKADMDKYAPKGLIRDDYAINAWIAVNLLKQVAEGIQGDVTAKSVSDALNGAKDLAVGPLAGYSPGAAPAVKKYPRVFNWTTYMSVVKDGTITAIDGDARIDPISPELIAKIDGA
jgi:ABC-type branched-subunit amino acid transport system substrate-binding protein